ncbi:MAG: DUF177 domain-containing protein [Geminicoccaceae bacterium]|nr:DUF177 domain-containing protein [Geminicoccaceae bacterium]
MPTRNLFAHPVQVDQLKAEGFSFDLVAGPDERAVIAHRLDLAGLSRLAAKGRVAPLPHGLVEVEGAFEADLSQRCVVTLDPFEAEVALPFRRLFTTLPETDAPLGEIVVDDATDEPEPVEAGMIDLGEVVVEELSLGLDPYPRGPGADEALRRHGILSEEEAEAKAAADARAAGPFAALAALRGKGGRSGES